MNENLERDVEDVAEVIAMAAHTLMDGQRKLPPHVVVCGLTRAVAQLLIANFGAGEGGAWLHAQANTLAALEPKN